MVAPVGLQALDPIDLPTLIAAGDLQTRIDRKYLLAAERVPDLLARIGPSARVLQIAGDRSFGYRTTYFDTPELTCYLAATRRRPRRYKVRTRTYLDSGERWLEVKTKDGRGRTVKTRTPYEDDLTVHRGFIESAAGHPVAGLAPELTTNYERATLYLPDDRARVTLDRDFAVHGRAGDRHWPEVVFVETKSGSAASAMDRLLWRLGQRPLQVSKYAVGLAALDPSLPANKWLPALRRLQP